MEKRRALTEKILLLGIDGLDPRLTRKYVDEGKMPNVKKYLERGAAREDLVLLGGHPTVTPPMWTTLATGCYANVHGITGFYRQSKTDLDVIEYNLDSRLCQAEPLWNVFAEAGKKTLVWHWPGSSWPPTSDSPDLLVVDGTSPGAVGMAISQVDEEFLLGANIKFETVTFKEKAASDAVAPCVVEDLDLEEDVNEQAASSKKNAAKYILKESEKTGNFSETALDLVQSPIKEASGWAAAPAGAKEFTLLLSKGTIRRPGLLLKDENGKYSQVALYKSKKDAEPIVTLEPGVMAREVIDEAIKGENKYRASRNFKVLNLDESGDRMSLYISAAMDIDNDSVYHPTRIYQDITENVGYPTPTSMLGSQDKTLITDCMLDCWYASADWQADAILHLIESEKLDVVFSHFHSVDLQGHMFIKHVADREFNRLPIEDYYKFLEDIYVQTDYYLGKFIHLLDEDWTICIFSDHALIAPKHDIPFLGDPGGINVRVLQELGFTVLKTDENGNDLPEIDWSKTRAVAPREQHIYLNLKGKYETGIVDPADQYELEEEIITALYGYRDKKTGHRIVAVALRNKDAVLLGQGGPEAGDICYWLAEGYNFDHADSLSTFIGEASTSVSPIFIASGRGVKQGFYTDRVIRQIDFAPTVAALGGVRMPAQCEGAPVYQILAEEF